MDPAVKAAGVLVGVVFIGLAVYQYVRGEAYTNTGWTKFSKTAWHSQEEHPVKFWLTIATQAICGGGVIIMMLFSK